MLPDGALPVLSGACAGNRSEIEWGGDSNGNNRSSKCVCWLNLYAVVIWTHPRLLRLFTSSDGAGFPAFS